MTNTKYKIGDVVFIKTNIRVDSHINGIYWTPEKTKDWSNKPLTIVEKKYNCYNVKEKTSLGNCALVDEWISGKNSWKKSLGV